MSGTQLGKAYVQVVPTTKGISNSISDALAPEGEKAGSAAGSFLGKGLVGTISKFAGALGIAKVIKDTITEGGKLQQSLGGIETIYGKHFKDVQKNAETAYKRANLSQNAYQELATGFGASLLQATKGNTEASAKAFDTMVVDMADNANKMGTPLELIQNAYNGFAKQNYTMLDNLKLGYGGTKQEMMRLLSDAEKLTGVKYDINNLKDVGDAIHAVQTNLKITGTTAKESAETLSGSWATMGSAFTNFLGKLALGQGANTAFMELVSSAKVFLIDNLIPMLWNIAKQIPGIFITAITEGIPFLIQTGIDLGNQLITSLLNAFNNIDSIQTTIFGFIDNLINDISTNLPKFLESGMNFINNILDGMITVLPNLYDQWFNLLDTIIINITNKIPEWYQKGSEFIINIINGISKEAPGLLNKMFELIQKVLGKIIERLPEFLSNGAKLVFSMITGILNNLPNIISAMANLLGKLIFEIARNLPKFLAKGLELIVKLATGIIQNIPYVVSKIPQVISGILNAFGALLSGIYNVGKNLIKGLWNGISDVTGWIKSKISGFASSILSSIKGFFGIHSPSRVFRNEVGAMLGQGLALGITDEVSTVSKAMDKIENEAMRDMSNDFDFNSKGNLKLNTQINDSELTLDNNRPLEIKLNMGGNTFRAFRETINSANDKDMELELAY
ncbi:hypothetical protein ABGF49_07325 [Helcococcus ovis]|uniref:phage tail protein n=1 Tax=Helcococcus TaxID=31983 RepID=UPI0038B989E9